MVVPVGNENVSLVKSKDLTMECQLFAANPERGRGRNHVSIFGFCIKLLLGILSASYSSVTFGVFPAVIII